MSDPLPASFGAWEVLGEVPSTPRVGRLIRVRCLECKRTEKSIRLSILKAGLSQRCAKCALALRKRAGFNSVTPARVPMRFRAGTS